VNDSTTDKVFKYTLAGSFQGSWTISTAGATSPTGITIDPSNGSQNIWIVDSGTDKVYQYADARNLNSGSRAATVSFALAVGNTNPQGIADPLTAGSMLANPLQTATATPVAQVTDAALERFVPAAAYLQHESRPSFQQPDNKRLANQAVDLAMLQFVA
jgi:hypothetical protein